YRYLDKQFWRSERLDFDLKAFATEHVSLSRGYDVGKLKEKMAPSLEELERAGFLAPLARDQRYVRAARGDCRVVFTRSCPPVFRDGAEAANEDLAPALLARGVSPRTAELVTALPPERIREKLAVHDAIRRHGGLGIRYLPGYLVASIRE